MVTYNVNSGSKTKITLDNGRLIIKYSGLSNKMNLMASGEITIYLKDIISIQVRKKPLFGKGYIKFNLPFDGVHGSLRSDNIVYFKSKKDYKKMLDLKDRIEEIILT